MKNHRTPRTLADSSFDVGYRGYVPPRKSRLPGLSFALMLAAFAAIGVMLAWRG